MATETALDPNAAALYPLILDQLERLGSCYVQDEREDGVIVAVETPTHLKLSFGETSVVLWAGTLYERLTTILPGETYDSRHHDAHVTRYLRDAEIREGRARPQFAGPLIRQYIQRHFADLITTN